MARLSSELRKLHDYAKDHSSIHHVEGAMKGIAQFTEEHSSEVQKIFEGVVKSAEDGSGKPIQGVIRDIVAFPSDPTPKNVIDWISKTLLLEFEDILDKFSKEFPNEAKYIDVLEKVIDNIKNVLDFVKKFM